MSPRARNPRRQLLQSLRKIRDRLTTLQYAWDIQMTVFEDGTWRPLRDDEKPENEERQWVNAWANVELALRDLTELQQFISQQYHLVKEQR